MDALGLAMRVMRYELKLPQVLEHTAPDLTPETRHEGTVAADQMLPEQSSQTSPEKMKQNLHGRKKLTMGRRKIEMKKIQQKASLQVTFTKRRTGLFKKASELCILCGSELAIIVQSPAKKFYAFESPSVESLLHRLDMGKGFNVTNHTSHIDAARREYEEALRMLEEKKKEVIGTAMNREIKEIEFWWDQQIEGMELQELEGYLESLEALRKNVSCRIEEMEKLQTYSSPSSVSAVQSQGSVEDTFGGLPIQNNYNNQELEKPVDVDTGDAAADDAHGYSNLGTNLAWNLDLSSMGQPVYFSIHSWGRD